MNLIVVNQDLEEDTMKNSFDISFHSWVNTACAEWEYPEPTSQYYDRVYSRIPKGLREILGLGIDKGIILTEGRKFTLKGLYDGKGPYNWFSRYKSKKEPAPNWEYFVQVAEYIRLFELIDHSHLTLKFEDDLMDLAVYDDARLIACYEVKEKANQIMDLIKGIKNYQDGIDNKESDRGNDPLRKVKYILKKKPEHFCGLAIGIRFEYMIRYPTDNTFQLNPDIIPIV